MDYIRIEPEQSNEEAWVKAGLKGALAQKRQDCAQAWQAFDQAKASAVAEGVDIATDSDAFKRLDGLYQTYQAAAREQKEFEARLVNEYEKESKVHTIPNGHRSGGVGAEFLRRIGAGVAGLRKAAGSAALAVLEQEEEAEAARACGHYSRRLGSRPGTCRVRTCGSRGIDRARSRGRRRCYR